MTLKKKQFPKESSLAGKIIAFLIFTGLIIGGFSSRDYFSDQLLSIELPVLGSVAGSLMLVLVLPLIQTLKGRELRQAWRQRFVGQAGIPVWHFTLLKSSKVFLAKLNDTLQPLADTRLGRILWGLWRDAGFGSHSLPLLSITAGIFILGVTVGQFAFGSLILTTYLTNLLLLGFYAWLYFRAKAQRQLFQDQFPDMLGRLADSLQAGFSLHQAIIFITPNLPEPIAAELGRVLTQIQIGFSVEQALASLHHRRPNEDTRLLLDGINLQRQTGGNMIEMIREIAIVVRQRVELNHEIRIKTSQGRLTAGVIALLVPVSLGILSLFPGYTDVLFDSPLGNLVLVAAGILELIGAAVVARLIRITV